MLHEMQLMKTSENFLSQRPMNEMPKLVPIAPSLQRKNISLDLNVDRRKYNYKSTPYVGAHAVSIARRNARERNRVKQVNDGFNALRKRLPAAVIAALSGGSRRGSGKKLSKVDTLKMVVEYIRHLENLIEESDAALGYSRENSTQGVGQTLFASEVDEGVFAGRFSPYSESVPSPANSECSSGVSSAYSSKNACFHSTYTRHEQPIPMDDDELLDAISWWQHK